MSAHPSIERFGLDALKAHYLYGIHSGIPQCCIMSWCKWVVDNNYVLAPIYKTASYRPCHVCYEKLTKGLIEPATIFICNQSSFHKYQVTHQCNTVNKFEWWIEFASSNQFSEQLNKIFETIRSGK